ncbi:hypothetical protein BDN72DRAFT_837501 [Pluteus cervinus]|uniref:Uncharacterized protein n=1 Tax=Pluteus cervinus TaxID=181527 RepID=A0ACD3B1Z3_9AGAR|nr:hypothetical protein BDN72DRAFT_837501 [Pluteus cervinus]
MDDLAFELLEQILEQVSFDSNPSVLSKTLRRCCLVSHTWKEIAQPLLFSTFTLYRRYYDLSRLYNTLSAYRHLQGLVKCTWVAPSMLSSAFFVDILREVVSNPQFRDMIIYRDFKYQTQSLIVLPSLISSPYITVLSFYRVTWCPIWMLYQCTSVRELHIYKSSFSGLRSDDAGELVIDKKAGCLLKNPGGDSSCLKDRPHLQHLYLESAESGDIILLKWFLHPDCAFDVSTLKTFHCLDMSNDITLFLLARKLVQRVPSLEELALDPPTDLSEGLGYISPEYPTFDPLPRLRRLKLSLQQEDDINLWPWTIRFLSGLAHPERLEELQLPCTIPDGKMRRWAFRSGWNDLDAFLTSHLDNDGPPGRRRFSNLRRISVSAVRSSNEEDKRQLRGFEAELAQCIPRLKKLGVVQISHSDALGFVKNSDCWYLAPFQKS